MDNSEAMQAIKEQLAHVEGFKGGLLWVLARLNQPPATPSTVDPKEASNGVA